MSKEKKRIRQRFRDMCLARDNHRCAMCGAESKVLDVHHITARTQMPNGGYVPENGISLCAKCHIKAEQFYDTGVACAGYSVQELYIVINSSYEKALDASKLLEDDF